jgi:leader peptidase (prepilin peptidase)/N-methyltransferase
MVSLILAIIGLPVGLALDRAIDRLAVPFDDDDGAEAEPAEAQEPASAKHPSLRAEAGSLAAAGAPPVAESPPKTWVRRLAVAGLTALLFAAVGARYDGAGHLAVVTAYVCVLIVCAGTDALAYRVPNVVTYPAMLGALIAGATIPGASIVEVLAGGLLAGGLLFIPSLLTGGAGMGMGDVKLATFAGLALGFTFVVPALVLMAVAGGVAAVVLLATGARRRGQAIPYAPFISAGVLASILWQGTAFVQLS